MQQETSRGKAGMQPPPAWVVGLSLVFITLALYWPARHFEFNDYDDAQYITQNPNVQHGLTPASVKWAFTAVGYGGNWHPLTWLSHLLDIELFGLHAGAHHFTSVLLHTANTLLLFLLLHRWTGALWRSAFVAALFGWHPLHVESVAWVAERKDVLSAFFWMLTLLAYGKYVERRRNDAGNGRAWRYYALALVLYALGLMAKPMLVSLPIIMLLLDYWPLKRIAESKNGETAVVSESWARLVAEKIPFFALSAAECVITCVAQRNVVQNLSKFPLWDRIGNALVSYTKYLGKTFWPMNLAVPYPYAHYLPLAEVLAAGILLLSVTACSLRFARSHPALFVGWFWFLITLVPVIGLVQVGLEPMADRYMYLPGVGVFLILAWEAPTLLKASSDDSLALPAAAVVLMGCWVLASVQIGYWRNSMTLWTHTLQVTKNNATAECNLGVELDAQGHYAEAVEHTRRALMLRPGDPEAENNLGWMLATHGDPAQAVPHLEAAAKTDPQRLKFHFNLALAYWKVGHLDESAAQYRSVIKLDPQFGSAHACLGDVLAKQGHINEAIDEYRAALRLNPGDKAVQDRLEQYRTQARNDEPHGK